MRSSRNVPKAVVGAELSIVCAAISRYPAGTPRNAWGYGPLSNLDEESSWDGNGVYLDPEFCSREDLCEYG